jgi:hypothetical protein
MTVALRWTSTQHQLLRTAHAFCTSYLAKGYVKRTVFVKKPLLYHYVSSCVL